jgi:hypothetical protein
MLVSEGMATLSGMIARHGVALRRSQHEFISEK